MLLWWMCLSGAAIGQSSVGVDSLIQASKDLPGGSAVNLLSPYLDQVGDPAASAAIHDRISDAFLEQGYLDSAAVHAWHVLRLAPADNHLCSRAYTRLGFISYQREAFERAEDFYSKASYLLSILQDEPALLMSRLYEARILDHLDRPGEALNRYEQAYQIAENQKDQVLSLQINFEMAGVLRKLSRYSDAEDILRKLVQVDRWDSTRRAMVWMEWGQVYEGKLDYRSAASAYRQALTYTRDTDPFPGYYQMLRMYFRLDRLDTANRYADSAEQAALSSGQLVYLRNYFRERHALAIRMMDTTRAYMYLQQFKVYDDSIQQETSLRNVQRIRDEQIISSSEALVRIAELEARDGERTERMARNEERFLWISGVSSLLGVLFLSLWFFNWRRYRVNIRRLQEQNSDLQVKNTKVFRVLAQDLQGPVSVFSNLTRSMPSELKGVSPADTAELLAHLHRSTQEVQQSLHEILDWAVTQSGSMPFRPEFFSCRNLADQVVKELEPWAAEHGVSSMLLVPEHVTTYADRATVRMVLRTLVYNAIRFSPEGAAVSVFSGKRDNLITVGVKDHGPGIDPERLNSLLNWTEAEGRARGIGLPMCRELVRRNGGDLYVESESGQGSTFYFTLPENPPGLA